MYLVWMTGQVRSVWRHITMAHRTQVMVVLFAIPAEGFLPSTCLFLPHFYCTTSRFSRVFREATFCALFRRRLFTTTHRALFEGRVFRADF